MKFVRRLVPALSLVVVIITSAAAPALASNLYPACANNQQHHCGTQARIASCCCGHDAAQPDGTPVQPRVELRVDLTAVPAATSDVLVAASPRPFLRVHTSPPFLSLRDLPTLFATLLI